MQLKKSLEGGKKTAVKAGNEVDRVERNLKVWISCGNWMDWGENLNKTFTITYSGSDSTKQRQGEEKYDGFKHIWLICTDLCLDMVGDNPQKLWMQTLPAHILKWNRKVQFSRCIHYLLYSHVLIEVIFTD